MKSKVPVFALLLIGFHTHAADLPPLRFPAGVGVNIHFNRGHERDLDMIAAAGFKFVRMDFGWAGIERQKGVFDWSAYDELTANLEKRGLRAVYILDYSNPLYESVVPTKNPIHGEEQRDTASPQHPESIAAFATWAAAAGQHFRQHGIIWEIWNEPNITFWKPKPDVAQYSALALAAAKALRQAVPEATIVGPASSGIPLEFIEGFFKSGVLEYLDAVSVHPYRSYSKSPESAGADYAKLRLLIERYAPAGKKAMPILSGEWGYASHTKGVTPEVQAAFIARQQLANELAGVPLSIWYDWKNDGTNPEEREDNFGTVTHDLQPKPAYVALQTLTRELAGFQIDHRLKADSGNDYMLVCTNAAGEQKLAAWTLGPTNTVAVRLIEHSQPVNISIVGSDGQRAAATLEKGALTVPLGMAPVYVNLDHTGVRREER